MTQKQLASDCGLTPQQIQKYENGTNELTYSRLRQISRVLGLPPGAFFPSDSNDNDAVSELLALVDRPDVVEMLRALKAINGKQRLVLVELIKNYAAKEDTP
jgi:transcriptional regulator with XRE-family HTH domain